MKAVKYASYTVYQRACLLCLVAALMSLVRIMRSAKMPTEGEIYKDIKCTKCTLIIFNLLFVLTGIVLIIIGTTTNTVYNELVLGSHNFSPATLLVVIGFILFGVSIFGVIGALKESVCIINLFGVLMSLVFVLEVGASVFGYMMKYQIHGALRKSLNQTMNNYYYSAEDKQWIDTLQTQLACCGMSSAKDWTHVRKPEGASGIPESCCVYQPYSDACFTIQSGCLPVLEFIVHRFTLFIAICAFILAVMQFIGLSFAFTLAGVLRKQKNAREFRKWKVRGQLLNENFGKGNLPAVNTA